jgi:hypothetical protein
LTKSSINTALTDPKIMAQLADLGSPTTGIKAQ